MSLRHALLGLLAGGPAGAHDLARDFEGDLGRHAWHAKHTAIAPELVSLQHAGLTEVVGTGARGAKLHAITGAGRDELRRWMLDVPRGRHVQDDGVLRLFLLSVLDPADARRLLDGLVARCTAEIDRLRPLMDRIDGRLRPGELPFDRLSGEYGIRQCEGLLAWAQWARDRLPPS